MRQSPETRWPTNQHSQDSLVKAVDTCIFPCTSCLLLIRVGRDHREPCPVSRARVATSRACPSRLDSAHTTSGDPATVLSVATCRASYYLTRKVWYTRPPAKTPDTA